MSQRSHTETSDFSQKMRHQGKAGFGAGPWTEPETIEIKARATTPPQTPERVRKAPAPGRDDKHPPCRLGDRILTSLAILSLGMLIVGALGAYLSNDSQRVAATPTGNGLAPPALARADSDARYRELEARLTELNERYGQRLHTLETKVEQTVDPYEARLARLESRLETSGNPPADELRNSGDTTASFDTRMFEARLAAIESHLQEPYAPFQAALRDLENRMGQGYASYDARLREMESRLMQVQIPYEQRLQALEQQLIYASARLDYLSAEMKTLMDDNAALVQASATLEHDPPAALPPEPAASPWTATDTNPVTGPLAIAPDTMPATTQTESVPGPAAETSAAPATEPVASARDATQAADTQPATMPMPATEAADPLPDSPPDDSVPPPTSENPGDAGGPATDATAGPETGAAPATLTPPIAEVEAALTPPAPTGTAASEVDRGNPPASAGNGDWTINLASYASESIATRKLADFKRKGVSAEQTVATVNGKTIYRVCITGFDTRKSAVERAETVRDQLGLKETWITRR